MPYYDQAGQSELDGMTREVGPDSVNLEGSSTRNRRDLEKDPLVSLQESLDGLEARHQVGYLAEM